MPVHHHPTLVVLSIVIAVLASYTTLDLTNSLVLARGRALIVGLTASALAMGTGIWSMHFTGMLAFHLDHRPISYEVKLLTASIVIAIAASMVALFLFTRPRLSRGTLGVAGFVMGFAISGMHYTGMAALRAPAHISWNYGLVALSILIAVAASFVALNLAGRIRSAVEHPAYPKIAGGIVLGFAIAGMHYTAMWAARFTPAPLPIGDETRVLATSGLAIAVIISSILILTIAITTSVASRSISRRTEQLRREQDLTARVRQSEEYYRALIDNASDLIAVIDDKGNRKFVSSSYKRVLGYDPAELLGGSAWDFLHEDDLPEARITFADLLSRPGARAEMGLRVRHADGSWRSLRVVAQNLLAHPSVRGIIMAAQDETERRRLEMQFQQSQKMEAVGKLAGGVAHDFNNLLTVIIGNTSTLLTDGDGEDVEEMLQEIHDAAARAAALTRQLLAFSRRQVLLLRTLDLNDVVRSMQTMIARLLIEDIEVQTRLTERLPAIRADAGQIEQVLLNLAINSRDAMPDGGLLTIATFELRMERSMQSLDDEIPAGRYVCLEVTDTGCGIDPALLPRVFEPFFTTKEVGKGTGLGLSTVYGIMKQSGGYVTVRTAPQQGATFRVLFPPVDEEVRADVAPATPAFEGGGSATILLVEDEPAVRYYAKRVLEQRGYHVIEAATGLDAIEEAKAYNGPIHLILSDVVLPDIDGREAADRISLVRHGARVLFMSGYTEDEIIHRGVLSSGLNFLQKPFTPAELLAKIKVVLDG